MTKLTEIFVSLQIIFLHHLFFPAFFPVKENGRLKKDRVNNKFNISEFWRNRKIISPTLETKILCSFYIIQTGGNQRKTQVFCERGNIQDVKKIVTKV